MKLHVGRTMQTAGWRLDEEQGEWVLWVD